jgi:hypothetical protein
MRLINTTTLKLEEFMGVKIPEYAILSHTWEDGEVTLHDFAKPELAAQKKGFAKIERSCRLARETGIRYAWVDTCCIDKTSSAELTEAINSMFLWYQASKVCYTYLPDLAPEDPVDTAEPTGQFARCRWFTRGWTLQELIAPSVVEFYDRDWNMRGTKAELSRVISKVTGIENRILRFERSLKGIPVAVRMSWAAKRQTTRVEDLSYCLLGIFDVNMPMLYGEGQKAFIRLQEEIAKQSNDLTLFAWQALSSDPQEVEYWGHSRLSYSRRQKHRGILAWSPAEFGAAGDLAPGTDSRFNEEFTMTNKGLRISAGLAGGSGRDYILSLNCFRQGDRNQQLGIYLSQHGAGLYVRDRPLELAAQAQFNPGKASTIYISKDIDFDLSETFDQGRRRAFHFRRGFDLKHIKHTYAEPENVWDSQNRLFLTGGVSSFTGYLLFQNEWANSDAIFMVACGISEDYKPWVSIANSRSRIEVFGGMNNLQALSEAGAKFQDHKVTFENKRNQTQTISVSLQSADINGQAMYCIDIHADDPEAAGPKGSSQIVTANNKRNRRPSV